MVSPNPQSDTFYGALTEMAEKLHHTIIGLSGEEERSGYVQRRVAESEIVFGVWPAPEEMGGFGFHLIKGRGHSAALRRAEIPDESTMTAVPCVGLEQALAAEQFWGDPGPSHMSLEITDQVAPTMAEPRPKRKRRPKPTATAPKKASRTRI